MTWGGGRMDCHKYEMDEKKWLNLISGLRT